jgi:acetyl-CoA C-acetyltransferase
MAERLVVAGWATMPFIAAGSSAGGLAERAIGAALEAAGVDVELIDQAVASRVHGEPACSERALARAGLTGIAISIVGNGDASGSVALFHARQALLSGDAQCVLAVGYEDSSESPSQAARRLLSCSTRLDRLAARAGIGEEAFARVAVKARAHGARNPDAVHRVPLSLEQAVAAPILMGRLRRSYVSAASCGAAALVLCTPRFAAQHRLSDDVLLLAHVLESDDPAEAAGAGDLVDALGGGTTRHVAERAYDSAGIGPEDVDVAEVHDCCVGDELIACAALGLCAPDAIDGFVRSGAGTYGGSVVVSPSGGMLSTGNAPGATGIVQICELARQLRGEAGARQVDGARIALQHNGTPGGAVAVAILARNG